MEKLKNTICVFTAEGIQRILKEGGTQAWVLSKEKALRECEYVVLVQNTNKYPPNNPGASAEHRNDPLSAKHRHAFLIGRLADVVTARYEKEKGNRWLLIFSEYAEISPPIKNAWPGNQNPVLYTSLQEIGIDISSLQFKPMPEQPIVEKPPVGSQSFTLSFMGRIIAFIKNFIVQIKSLIK